MEKLLDQVRTRRCHLILDECDVIKAINVINKHHRVYPTYSVGNCGWTDDRKWFVDFTTTIHKWDLIRHELEVKRVFDVVDIPENSKGVFSTD